MFENSPTFNTKTLDWKSVFLILFLLAFFIRFPFFFRDYIDRDESTFILMGQSWVNGFLPYTQLWDLKPPITFFFFSIIIKVFGKSFLAIRFFGSLLVALTALFTYVISSKITTKKVAFWVAIFCVFFISLFGSMQGVMSEHICTFFFVAGLFLIFLKESSKWHFTAGLLLGLSVMSKLSMAYPVLTLGIYLLSEGLYKKQVGTTLKNLSLLGIGFFFSIGLTTLPYVLQGEFQTWWESVIIAPLAYTEGKFHSPLKTLPLVILVFGLLGIGFKFKLIDWKSRPIQILTVVIIGILTSFMQTGKVNGHYLIQLYPFILIPVGMAVAQLPELNKKYKPLIIVLLLLIPMESYLEYGAIISNKIKQGTFFNGEGIAVPQYIVDHNLDTENIFFTEYHIGYWVLGVNPPTMAATHPSNITRDELFPLMHNPRKTGVEELKYIMEVIQPKTIVARKGKKVFDKKLLGYNDYIDFYLEQNYTLVATVDRGLIYQRLD